MNRRKFITRIVGSILGLAIMPKVLLNKDDSNFFVSSRNNNGVTTIFKNGKYSDIDLSQFDVFYDFTDEQYAIKNSGNQIIGWKDLSGHSFDAMIITANTEYPCKKFAIKNGCNYYTDEYVIKALEQ